MNIADFSLAIQVLIAIFAGSFFIQMIYWWRVYARLVFHKPGASGIKRSPVSVIICAKNEEENLKANLPLFLEQDYPDYEVIVVNDASTDESADVLADLQKKYPHLRTSVIKENVHIRRGKKLALTLGLKAAKHDWVLLTDADCIPAGNKWLATMQRNFKKKVGIVLGYGGYKKDRGLLNMIIRYDAFFVALQYIGFALAGFPYMGVGRNLAYRRDLFFRNKGFASHYELSSGDDDLFVNEVARRKGTRIEIRQESHTLSETEKTWRDWYYQKKRHLTTGPRYRPATKILLGTEILSRGMFYISFICLLIINFQVPYVLGIFLLRIFSTLVIIKLAMIRLNEKYLLLISPVLDFILPLLHIWMAFSNYVASKRARWK
ncbi:glycosyltransferase [Bacteroidota bacterium]